MAGLRLYELDEMFREAMDIAEHDTLEDGSLPDDWASFLDDLEVERSKKRINVALVAREKAAEADAIAVEIKRLHARKKAAENVSERLRGWLAESMQAGEKEKDERASISCTERDSYEYDEEQIPPRYFRARLELSKAIIQREIKAGASIDGVTVTKQKSITIR